MVEINKEMGDDDMSALTARCALPTVILIGAFVAACGGGGGGSSTGTNTAPVADAQSVTTDEDNALGITLAGSDGDGDTLSFSVITQPAHGTLSGTAPNLTYTPAANFNGSDSFSFTVNDGTADSAAATISIIVNAVNDAPIAAAQSLATNEDTVLDITLTGSDTDGDGLMFFISGQPSHGTLSGTAPNLTYTPAANYNGSDAFSFTVNDGATDSTAATIDITVNAVSDVPVADAQRLETDEDTALAITLAGSDGDGDTLSFSVATQPAHGTLSGTAPSLTYTPAANFNGSDSFSFTVNDGTTDSAAAIVDITVLAVNDAPVASDGAESSYPGATVSGTLQASDLEGDSLTFSIVVQGSMGEAVINDANTGAYSYIPYGSSIGTDTFTFKTNDGSVDSNIATVTITDIAPATPTSGLSATAGDQRVTVNWDPVEGADSYTIYWSDTPGTGTGGTASTVISPPFYHDGLTNGSTYYYVVSAGNVVGESAASTEVSATPVDIALSSLTFPDSNLASCVSTAASGLTYVHELTSLFCGAKGITDITGVEALTSLTTLNLGANSIVYITPIQGLTNLTVLGLSGNDITDISPVSRLTNLTSLTLNGNILTDISGLEDLSQLVTLHLYQNSIADITPLAGLTALTELRIYTNNIVNVSPLTGLSSLKTLMLDENSIVDVAPLSGLISLQYLYLSTNSIVDVNPLASLTGLKTLSLLNNTIGGQGVGNVDDLVSLTVANAIILGSNPGMSCAELTALIDALGSPPVSVHPTGSLVAGTAQPGTNCTNP